MKKWTTLAVTALFAFGLAACGGSSGTSTTGTGTASTATPQAKTATAGFANASNTLMQQVFQSIGGAAAQRIKAPVKTVGDVDCAISGTDSWTCTVSDTEGGSCTMTVSYTESQSSAAVTADMDCTTFHADSDTTIDGNYDIVWTIDVSNMQGASAQVAKDDTLVLEKTDASNYGTEDACTTTDDTTIDDGYCTESATACSESSSDFFVSMVFTIGNRGLTITTSCGNYVYSAGASLSFFGCGNFSTGEFVMTTEIDGTFNNETMSGSYSYTCNYGAAS